MGLEKGPKNFFASGGKKGEKKNCLRREKKGKFFFASGGVKGVFFLLLVSERYFFRGPQLSIFLFLVGPAICEVVGAQVMRGELSHFQGAHASF